MQQCQEGQIQFACCGHCRKLLRSSRHFCVWFTYTMDCGGQRLTGTNGLWRNCAGNLEFLFRLCAAMRQNMPETMECLQRRPGVCCVMRRWSRLRNVGRKRLALFLTVR